ncbi:MAG TPA: VWA domain-containing protein [Acidobacteriaceae bacterium]|nr:VWA domain-containing protein [Acidobacteriaceae bacterium]
MKISARTRSFLPAIALALCAFHAPAQSTGQNPAPAATPEPAAAPASPISLPVTVVDKKGDPVKDLKAGDVTLTDNGHIQTIQSFALAQPSPMTFGVIGQISPNQRTEIGDVRLATVHFLDHTLPGSDDRAFLIQYDRQVDLLEDPTATTNKLHDAVTQLGSRQFGDQNGNSDESQDERRVGNWGGTLYDAIYLASSEVIAKEPGHHILVLIGDGIDRDSKVSLGDAVAAAQAAHAAIFAIYFEGDKERPDLNRSGERRGGIGGNYPGTGGGYPGGGGRRGGDREPAPQEPPHADGKETLEHLCNATGGYMVEGKRDKAEDAYNKLSALLKYQYTLTWVPDQNASQSKTHHVTLNVTKKNDVWAIVQQDFSIAQ